MLKQTKKSRIFDEIENLQNDNYVTYKQLETMIRSGWDRCPSRGGLGLWAPALYDKHKPLLLTPTKNDPRYLVKIKRGLYKLSVYDFSAPVENPQTYEERLEDVCESLKLQYEVPENNLFGMPVSYVRVTIAAADQYKYWNFLRCRIVSAYHQVGGKEIYVTEIVRIDKTTLEVLPQFKRRFFEQD
jgi:hypothetical protein